MEVIMTSSLPARQSLEQLKKLAKDLAKQHEEKQPDALALIARHLPVLTGKSALDIAAYPFALHDAQSVIARQYGFPSWNELSAHVGDVAKADPAPTPDLAVTAKLLTVLRAREKMDYALFCSVMSEQMKAAVPQAMFESVNQSMSAYFQADYRITYMGCMNSHGNPVHFWRLWVPGWDNDLLIRMVINSSGLISGLLYTPPFGGPSGRK
jgi:hypothetical protein